MHFRFMPKIAMLQRKLLNVSIHVNPSILIVWRKAFIYFNFEF